MLDDSTTFDAVVFDVGKVLFDFSFVPFASFLEQAGYSAPIPLLLEAIRLREHEHGELSADDFLSGIESLLPQRVERAALLAAWTEIFEKIDGMHELLERIRTKHKVFLLSNTSELHWKTLEKQYGINAMADGIITSYQVGIMKPDHGIYEALERRYELAPTRIVFIDDLPANIETATSRGWRGVHHRSVETTESALRALGIHC